MGRAVLGITNAAIIGMGTLLSTCPSNFASPRIGRGTIWPRANDRVDSWRPRSRIQHGSRPASTENLGRERRIVEGMQPDRLFECRYNSCRFSRLPNSAGISPVNALN